MRRVNLLTLLGFLVLMPAMPADADWHTFWNRVHLDWHRNNCWPEPFRKIDRRTVCTTLATQIGTGWKRQNTLTDVYFEQDSQVLNVAGRRKIWSILASTPDPYRTIYVVESMNREAHERRLDSVQQAVGEILTEEALPEVVSIKIPPRSWPADYIDQIDRKFQTSIATPRLPQFTDTTSN